MINDLSVFFKETYQELLKIIWPNSREFFINSTGTFFLVFLFAMYFGLIDILISLCLTKLLLFFV
ncbi:preprotein translocase subunit SecE [Candidatus Dependentiae bacterium]|nr:preprotein translocase subunit SecE [Candidatus Dependentiae bacterium]